MTVVLAIGYLATALNVLGNLMLAHKNLLGWLVRLAVNALYVVYAAQIDDGGPMVANHVVFAAINVHGFVLWRRTGALP